MRYLIVVICLCWICVESGCESAVRKSAEVRPVSGRITVNGNPVQDAKILFVPVQVSDSHRAYLEPSHATTDEDGNYTLETHSGREGACVGRHLVWISTRRNEQHDLPPRPAGADLPADLGVEPETIADRFNRDTELFFDVAAEGDNVADFDLTR